jgi:hemoglobin-like flavoprotein
MEKQKMHPNAVKLVQESWAQIATAGPAAAALFHCNLLHSRPWLVAPYTGYVDERDAMVMRTFGHAIQGMHMLETHSSLLLQIGRVNAVCGVQSHHYPYFEVALLQTLEQILGDTLTEPLKQAWIAVFGTMARLMLAGANGQSEATVAIRQHASDRRRQRRRAAHDMGGNRGYHRRAGPESNRRLHRMPV